MSAVGVHCEGGGFQGEWRVADLVPGADYIAIDQSFNGLVAVIEVEYREPK